MFNTVLLAYQRPGCTIVGGYKQWQQHGRQVKKGESGLCIWFPVGQRTKTDERTGEETTTAGTFYLGTVFDISQTEAVVAAVAA